MTKELNLSLLNILIEQTCIENQAEDLLLLGVSGSRLYGLNKEDSDYDIRGIFIAKKDYWVGAKTIDKIHLISPPFDIELYDIRNYAKSIFKGSCNLSELLFLNEPNILYKNEAFDNILPNLKGLFSKSIFKSFTGFAYGSLTNFLAKRDSATWKKLCHCYRIIGQAIELARDGQMTFPKDDKSKPTLGELLEIKNGQTNIVDHIDYYNKMIQVLNDEIQKSKLPEKGDFSLLNDLLMDIYDSYF